MHENISPVTAVTLQTRSWALDDGNEGGSADRRRISDREPGKDASSKQQLTRIRADFDEMDSGYGTEPAHDDGATAAFQVIILGGGGGPGENDTTGLLIRSTSTEWTKGSVMAVDAGVHLSAIDEVFKQHLPKAVKVDPPPKRGSRLVRRAVPIQPDDPSKPKFFPPVADLRVTSRAPSPVDASPVQPMNVMTSGPFRNLMVPYETSAAISAYFLRNLVSTVLISHPHLDHLSGFAINTAALQNTTKPKKVVGLPSTIEAIKTHIFNDVIWPNMSDEEGGIGFVSYQRLSEGGHSLLGEHEAAGYIEVCDSLAVKAYLVSHGNCVRRHRHRGSGSAEPSTPDVRRRSSRFGSISGGAGTPTSSSHSDHHVRWPTEDLQTSGWSSHRCIVDSSAFFIRDDETTQEVLIFGDVEPDKVSAEPRNYVVWAEAAPKIARHRLNTIFIECSYDDSQGDTVLFGHLAPRHVVSELAMLAAKVTAFRQDITNYRDARPKEPAESPNGFTAVVPATAPSRTRRSSASSPVSGKKRPHESPARRGSTAMDLGDGNSYSMSAPAATSSSSTPPAPHRAKKRSVPGAPRPLPERAISGVSPLSSPVAPDPAFIAEALQVSWDTLPSSVEAATAAAAAAAAVGGAFQPPELAEVDVVPPDGKPLPLEGVRVVIIHVKDPLRDSWDPRALILRQLRDHEKEWRLGCEFVMCKRGDSIWA